MDDSSLLDDLSNPTKTTKNTSCKIGKILQQLEKEEAQALQKAISLIRSSVMQGKNRTYSSVWLSKVLRKNGYHASVSTVQRHVNKECSCDQPEE